MNLRRVLISIVVVAGFLAGVSIGRGSVTATSTRFAVPPYASRPYASHRTPISTTWYCPGVPAAGDSIGGEVVVANPTDVAINGHITYIDSNGDAPVVQTLVAPPRDRLTLDVRSVMTADFVTAVVELDGGEGMVEQRAIHPAGDAVSSCVTETASTWYFADGWTADDSTEQLVISNPYEDTVGIDEIVFYTKSGPRAPAPFQGDSIAAQSVKVIDVASIGLQDEEIIGVQIVANRGRLIAARAQHYVGGGRLGYTLTMGVPAPTEQLWFADGDHGDGISESYVLLNPTEEDIEATVTVLGIAQTDTFAQPEGVQVPAGDVVTFDTSTITGLPDGPHSMVFSVVDGSSSLIAERVITRTVDDTPVTTIVSSMTPEYAFAPRWYVPIGVDEAVDDALVVYNPYQSAATITLSAVGPGGEVPVPGLDAIDLPGAGITRIDLTDPSVFGKILVVDASAGVFVERLLPRGHDLPGLSGSWALPECGPCKFSSPPSSS